MTADPHVKFVMRFSKFTRGSSVFHTSKRNKQVEFNPYIYTLSKWTRLAMKYPFLNTQQGGIQSSHRKCRCNDE